MFRLIRWLFQGNFLYDFCFGTAFGAIMFAVVTGTTISCSLGRWYGPVRGLSFLDVYGSFTLILTQLAREPS
jgi:hypothetical protein